MAKYIQDTIRTLMAAHKNATFWIGGDFNLPNIDWDMATIRIPPGSKQLHYAKAINDRFLCMKTDLGLEQSVKEPTRGNSCFALFFTNRPSLVKRTEVVSGVSDHAAILVEAQAVAVQTKKPRCQILLWSKADTAGVCRSLKSENCFRQHTSSSSSRMRVIYHNWSATKQRPNPQSVAEISHHSVLSGDRIRQCETSSGSRHKDTDQCL